MKRKRKAAYKKRGMRPQSVAIIQEIAKHYPKGEPKYGEVYRVWKAVKQTTPCTYAQVQYLIKTRLQNIRAYQRQVGTTAREVKLNTSGSTVPTVFFGDAKVEFNDEYQPINKKQLALAMLDVACKLYGEE